MKLKTRRVIYISAAAVFLLISVPLVFYNMGYRVSSDLKISKTGGIYVYSPESGSEIFLENKLRKKTNILQSGVFIQNLKPKFYSVLVAKEGYWPWQKNLNVKESLVSEASAFLIKKEPEGKVILKGQFFDIFASPDGNVIVLTEKTTGSLKKANFYLPKENKFLTSESQATQTSLLFRGSILGVVWENGGVAFKMPDNRFVRAAFDLGEKTVSASPISASLAPKFDERNAKTKGQIKIWVEGANAVYVDWLDSVSLPPYYLCESEPCAFPKQVSPFKSEVRNIDFLPKRRDVIVLAVEDGIYALELDGRGGRMLQPIYKGKKPHFAVSPNEEKIYILDSGNLAELSL